MRQGSPGPRSVTSKARPVGGAGAGAAAGADAGGSATAVVAASSVAASRARAGSRRGMWAGVPQARAVRSAVVRGARRCAIFPGLVRGLYPIIDLDALAARGLEPLAFARAVLAARPALVQLRAKHASPRDALALLVALAPLCREAGVRLFANDRPDLALAAGCDGVHVGQDDLACDAVRRIAPSLAVGVSTHDPAQLAAALAARPDYVAFGPVFATGSKQGADAVVGRDALARAAGAARAAGVPLCAIGGFDEERIAAVARHADLVAVIGALLPPDGALDAVTARAVALSAAWRAGVAP